MQANEQLLPTARASEAAGSLRSPAASFMIAPQQNCGRYAATTRYTVKDLTSSHINRMRAHAEGYLADAELLAQQASAVSDGAYLLKLIAFEVLLKAALLKNGTAPARHHKYTPLFDQLPSAARERILAAAASRFGSHTDFRCPPRLLDTWSANFVRLRYAYETYEGMTAEEISTRGEAWLADGAKVEEADFQYHPLELQALTEALLADLQGS